MSDKTRIITLTGRPPVKIIEANWPVIACGKHEESDADGRLEIAVNVRQHQDGRAIVYAIYDNRQNDEPLQRELYRVGETLDAPLGNDICDCVQRICRELGEYASKSHHRYIESCAIQCMANMPAEDLDAQPEEPGDFGLEFTPGDAWSDDQIREFMRAGGAKFHGPNVEHISMPEAAFFDFFRDITQKPAPFKDPADKDGARPANWPAAAKLIIDTTTFAIKDENGFEPVIKEKQNLVFALIRKIEEQHELYFVRTRRGSSYWYSQSAD